MMCDCEDKTILVEGDGEHIARETWCKVHGYESSCYLCYHTNCTTELCTRHRQWLSAVKGDYLYVGNGEKVLIIGEDYYHD